MLQRHKITLLTSIDKVDVCAYGPNESMNHYNDAKKNNSGYADNTIAIIRFSDILINYSYMINIYAMHNNKGA